MARRRIRTRTAPALTSRRPRKPGPSVSRTTSEDAGVRGSRCVRQSAGSIRAPADRLSGRSGTRGTLNRCSDRPGESAAPRPFPRARLAHGTGSSRRRERDGRILARLLTPAIPSLSFGRADRPNFGRHSSIVLLP